MKFLLNVRSLCTRILYIMLGFTYKKSLEIKEMYSYFNYSILKPPKHNTCGSHLANSSAEMKALWTSYREHVGQETSRCEVVPWLKRLSIMHLSLVGRRCEVHTRAFICLWVQVTLMTLIRIVYIYIYINCKVSLWSVKHSAMENYEGA